jgi:hypothetical protein
LPVVQGAENQWGLLLKRVDVTIGQRLEAGRGHYWVVETGNWRASPPSCQREKPETGLPFYL